MEITFLTLTYFQKVARMEHLSQAAEELHIAQPSLSRVFQRGTVNAEQMGGRPAAGVLAEEQHPQ